MINIDREEIELSGGKIQVVSEVIVVLRAIKSRYKLTDKEMSHIFEVAMYSQEELTQKTIEIAKKQLDIMEKSIIESFTDFMEKQEDCDNCHVSEKCPMKELYDDVKSGKAGANEIMEFTMSSHEVMKADKEYQKYKKSKKSSDDDADDILKQIFKDLM